MTISYNEQSIPGRHRIHYRTRDAHRRYPERTVEVLATPEEIRDFVRDGFLVRENLLPMQAVVRLREALDEVLANEEEAAIEKGGKTFGGVFLRHLADKHPAFLDLIDFAPVVSIARALFGPAVSLRGLTARIVFPDAPYSEVEWHFHQRVVPDPLPPMFQQPQVLDCLIYLDDMTNPDNGPLCVMPGSHQWLERDLDTAIVEPLPGEIVLRVPPGSGVLSHGSLWHRALPLGPNATLRRMLILGYSPSWQKSAIYGKKPANGLTRQLIESNELSEEMRELLGVGGYM